MSLKPLTLALALATSPALAEETPRFDPYSAIFNTGVNDFIGITIQGCSADGTPVNVTMNPVAHKNDIAHAMTTNRQAFQDAAQSALQNMPTLLRETISGLGDSDLKALSRFGHPQRVQPLMDHIEDGGFPIQLQGVRMYTQPAKPGIGCLFS